ncbi:MAG: hypothetical protein DME26_13085, partial [Verrucomicrobia bacterium]
NGMLLSVQKRFSGNLSWNTNYTWSKCMNDGEVGQNIGNAFVDTYNRRLDRAVCDSDRASIINSSLLAQSPRIGSERMKKVTGGWQLSTIYTFTSGAPVNVTS